ncbi:hypothetical protein KAJ61_01785 [Candidatus Parcubacteria bacterium]|nr:hypothetical protein [Candidatus Parcubacteria bacterium]
MKKTTIFILTFAILGIFFSQSVLAIGQMIKPIIIKDVLRGSEITDILILFNSEDNEAVYALKCEGEIADWASFYKIDDTKLENPVDEVLIPAKSYFKTTVKFTIPKDAPNGEYIGEVAVMTAQPKNKEIEKVAVSIFERIGREVSITVTDQEIVQFKTTIIPLEYSVGKNQPLEIKIIHTNQGNVSVKPDIQLKITKSGKTVSNVVFPYPEDENPVRPRERKTMPLIEWQTAGLEKGAYQAEVIVLLGNKTIKEAKFNFSVGTRNPWGIFGILNKSGKLINAHLFNIMIVAMAIMSIITIYIKTSFFKNQLTRINALRKQ